MQRERDMPCLISAYDSEFMIVLADKLGGRSSCPASQAVGPSLSQLFVFSDAHFRKLLCGLLLASSKSDQQCSFNALDRMEGPETSPFARRLEPPLSQKPWNEREYTFESPSCDP